MSKYLSDIVKKQKNGIPAGVLSVCTANIYVIKATMQKALKFEVPVLIEATANQVDQNGGYTGMTPADFVSFIREIADEIDFPWEEVILGGDHLGPLTRSSLNENEAMEYSDALVREYVLAGFSKIHLDTSMHLGGDAVGKPLPDLIVAERGARLCAVCEKAYEELKVKNPNSIPPVYVIGSEVPIPGGTQSSEEVAEVTPPQQCANTYDTYKNVFEKNGLSEAFERVIAIVVQTGAEFGDADIFKYDSKKARELTTFGKLHLPLVFEGHSTDYQTESSLCSMVSDGIAILKVGPALTFALREALFALEMIEKELYCGMSWKVSNFREVLELAMLNHPENWQNHYHGNAAAQCLARKYSFSDRSRYYLNVPSVSSSINCLIDNINKVKIPLSLISQYLPREFDELVEKGNSFKAEDLIFSHIGFCLENYYKAVFPELSKL